MKLSQPLRERISEATRASPERPELDWGASAENDADRLRAQPGIQ